MADIIDLEKYRLLNKYKSVTSITIGDINLDKLILDQTVNRFEYISDTYNYIVNPLLIFKKDPDDCA